MSKRITGSSLIGEVRCRGLAPRTRGQRGCALAGTCTKSGRQRTGKRASTYRSLGGNLTAVPTDAEVKAAIVCANEVRTQQQGTPKQNVIDNIYKVMTKLLNGERLEQADRDSVPQQLSRKL